MQHIIWVTPGFAADENDSQCIPPQQLLAKALLDEGVQLHIVSLHYPHKAAPYHWHGADVYPCYYTGPLAKVRIWLKSYHQIRILCQAYPEAILHSFWLNDACLLAQWVDRFRGQRHLVTLMGQDARPSNRYLRLLPLSSLYKVALSPFHATQFQQSTGLEVDEIIPWGLPTKQQSGKERPYHLIAIGSLIPLKQFDDFVQLVADLKDSIPDLRCLLVGEGPEHNRLLQLRKDLDLENELQLTGSLPRGEVLQLLAQSRVFVHPSSYESFGFVLVEALQQGAKVVARPVGIAPELEGAQLVETRDEFRQAALDCLRSTATPELPIRYQLAQVQAAYLQLYNKLATGNDK